MGGSAWNKRETTSAERRAWQAEDKAMLRDIHIALCIEQDTQRGRGYRRVGGKWKLAWTDTDGYYVGGIRVAREKDLVRIIP